VIENETEECRPEENFGSHDENLISLPNFDTYSSRRHPNSQRDREDRRETL